MAIAALTIVIAEPSMSETKPQTALPPAAHCVGRFNFALPADLTPTGREQRIYLSKVWSEATPAGADPQQAWARHLMQIKQPPPSDTAPKLLREFNLAGVGPAVWYRPLPMNQDDLMLLTTKPGQGFSLFLETDASAGLESIAEQGLTRLAAGFVPGSSEGFCVQHGAFVMRPSKNEQANAGFSGGGVKVAIRMETVAVPDDIHAGEGDVAGITTLIRQARNVGDFKGMEERVRITAKNAKPALAYSWISPGQVADGQRPRIHLKASAAEDRQPALDAAWKVLLESLRLRPVGVRW
jgi:hypothetical protein